MKELRLAFINYQRQFYKEDDMYDMIQQSDQNRAILAGSYDDHILSIKSKLTNNMERYTLEEIRNERLCISPMRREQLELVVDAFKKAYPSNYEGMDTDRYFRPTGYYRFYNRNGSMRGDWYGSSANDYSHMATNVSIQAMRTISFEDIALDGVKTVDPATLNEMAEKHGIKFKF